MVVAPGTVWLTGDHGSELLLADPDGWVQELVDLLDGRSSRSAIHRALHVRWSHVADSDVAAVIAVLDAAGFVDDFENWAYFHPPRRVKYELGSWHELANIAMSG
jgi:hypothetical protein